MEGTEPDSGKMERNFARHKDHLSDKAFSRALTHKLSSLPLEASSIFRGHIRINPCSNQITTLYGLLTHSSRISFPISFIVDPHFDAPCRLQRPTRTAPRQPILVI